VPMLHTAREGRVLTVTIEHPPSGFMTGQMVDELDALTRALEGDRSIGAVVLTGARDGVFVMHYDVAEIVDGAEQVGASVGRGVASGAVRAVGALSRLPGAGGALGRTPAAGIVELHQVHEVFVRMGRLEQVFIAALNGTATGGGCELALACDLRYMADGPFNIGLPELSLGIIPGAGGTQRMVRALGPATALELMLEARPLQPADALAAGLVHRVLAPGDLLAAAQETAARLARRSPATVGALKRAVYDGGSRSLAAGLHIERAEFLAVASAPAAIRGMRAYADEVETLEDPLRPPWNDPDGRGEAWFDGTAVDLTT
jgi:enoyl-CoA hydratase